MIETSDLWLETVTPGSTLSAAKLLLQFGETEGDALEEILYRLAEKNVKLDISDLPAQKHMGEGAQRLKTEEKLAKEGLSPEKLPENDPLRLYLEEVAAIPVCGDVALLWEQKKTAQLLELCLSRVIEIATEFTGYGVLLLDLIQEGSMGLMESLELYTGNRRDFENYRDQRIRYAMARAVTLQAQAFGVGERLRQGVEDYRATDERLLAELGRNPSLEEMAEALHMTPEEAANLEKTLTDIRMLSRAKQPENTDLPQEEEQAVEDTAYFQMRQRIEDLMTGLEEGDIKLLKYRYALDGGIPLTAEQVACQLGMTLQQVQQREAEILAKLRNKKEA